MSGPTQEKIDAYLRDHVLPGIERHGFVVQQVFAVNDGQSSFSYTAGLTTRGWPELIALGPVEFSAKLLNFVVKMFDDSGRVPAPGEVPDFLDSGYSIRLRECSTRTREFSFTTAHAIYPEITGLQVVVPDDEHRYPGDEGATLSWQRLVDAP